MRYAPFGSVRDDMLLECCSRPSQIGPHQVTYDAVAWPIYINSVRYDMLLECCSQPVQNGPHQVTYEVVAWPIQ
eukprot:scaffold4052_cov123-Skeletonema_dohrnii-CCMP3373.AAC.10